MKSTGKFGGGTGIKKSVVLTKNLKKTALFKVWKSRFFRTSGAYQVMRKNPMSCLWALNHCSTPKYHSKAGFNHPWIFFRTFQRPSKPTKTASSKVEYAIPRFWRSPKSLKKNRNFFKTLQKRYLGVLQSFEVPKHAQSWFFDHLKASRTLKKSAFWGKFCEYHSGFDVDGLGNVGGKNRTSLKPV